MSEVTPIRYVVFSQVDQVYERQDMGWFVQFSGSHESLFLGVDKPDFKEDDYIRITIEKANPNAKPI